MQLPVILYYLGIGTSILVKRLKIKNFHPNLLDLRDVLCLPAQTCRLREEHGYENDCS